MRLENLILLGAVGLTLYFLYSAYNLGQPTQPSTWSWTPSNVPVVR